MLCRSGNNLSPTRHNKRVAPISMTSCQGSQTLEGQCCVICYKQHEVRLAWMPWGDAQVASGRQFPSIPFLGQPVPAQLSRTAYFPGRLGHPWRALPDLPVQWTEASTSTNSSSTFPSFPLPNLTSSLSLPFLDPSCSPEWITGTLISCSGSASKNSRFNTCKWSLWC